MEWNPRAEGVQELIALFKESRGNNNEKHREIFEKINLYSKNKEFTNYLIYILNEENVEENIRNVSGMTLKGIMERQFNELEEEELNYFKKNILKSYLDKKPTIRRAISNLVNTYLRNGGVESWPEILEILFESLNDDVAVDMSLETLIMIFEDSGHLLEDKYKHYIINFSYKLTNYIKQSAELHDVNSMNSNLIILSLTALHILLENCSNSLIEIIENITSSLLPMGNSKNYSIRYRVGRCWLVIVRLKKEILLTLGDTLFNFFYENLAVEYYEMNFTASEFYLFVVEELENKKSDLKKNEKIIESLLNGVRNSKIIPHFFNYTRLTSIDICGEEVDNKNYNKSSTKSKSSNSRNVGEGIEEENYDESKNKFDVEFDEDDIESYTTNWTLRKCSSKLLDKFARLYPEDVIENLIPYLEKDIQHKDWVMKEKSILALGAVAVGSYEYLKPYLENLLRYLVEELNNSNKLVRAISCWTISRFSNYILSNNEELLRFCLSEILKRFLDAEPIVQEAACTAFNAFLSTRKEKLVPYLIDVFKIFNSAFENYSTSSLLILYDSIEILTTNFPEKFNQLEIVEELLVSILKKWYEIVNLSIEKDKAVYDARNIAFLDVLASIIKVSSGLIANYFEQFMNGSLTLIENSADDKEVICKSFDIISVLCQVLPAHLRQSENKFKIVGVIFDLLRNNNDAVIKQYILALIGDICKVDTNLLVENVDVLVKVLIENLHVHDRTDLMQVSVCNNSCWTLGILSKTFKQTLSGYVDNIMMRVIILFGSSKLNKSLAQNASICIGRLALINPEVVSKYIESFLKQFCLSMKIIEDSEEKQDAFSGLCNAILHNPTAALTHFAFLCDALSTYNNSPNELEKLFQSIVLSYKNMLKDNWDKFINTFPEKLKSKMRSRFKFLQN